MRNFQAIVTIAKDHDVRTVVEIGSIRANDPAHVAGDGHATRHWVANFERVFSYDIDPGATALTRQLAGDYGNLVAETRDGVLALAEFDEPIDLLYLDAWDVGTEFYMERHLAAFKAAEDNLHDKSLVLIDDTEYPGHGKAGLVLEYATSRGWTSQQVGKQTLFLRPSGE